jgi:hypothetical protein
MSSLNNLRVKALRFIEKIEQLTECFDSHELTDRAILTAYRLKDERRLLNLCNMLERELKALEVEDE